MSIRIITDSGSDLTQAEARQLNITVLPLKISFGSEEYLDGVTLSQHEFYEKLVETDELPHTSQLTPYDYEAAFQEIVDAGDTAVCITLSSGLSGCYQSASIGATDYDGKIRVIDSQHLSISQRVLVEYAVRLRDAGKSLDEIVEAVTAQRDKTHVIALLDTLEYLKKGGRITPAAAALAGVLSIKPVVTVQDGRFAMLGKARGSKNANNLLTEFIKKTGDIDVENPMCLGYAGLSDTLLQKYLHDHASAYEDHKDKVPVSIIGSAIGTHVGPGTIAFAFMTK